MILLLWFIEAIVGIDTLWKKCTTDTFFRFHDNKDNELKNKDNTTSSDINKLFDLFEQNITTSDIISYLEKQTAKEYKRIIKIINEYKEDNMKDYEIGKWKKNNAYSSSLCLISILPFF